jgi:probable H4MPT-linked C1 transfer pathway protein
LVKVLGYDIGGANTKAALINTRNGKLRSINVALEYFPVWKNPEKLTNVLLSLKKRLDEGEVDGLGVTMTAELSDAYATKREGVWRILTCIKEAFPSKPIYVVSAEGKTVPFSVAQKEPLAVAAANWAATGWMVAQRVKNCVIVDVGSTSSSIIPIVNGQVVAHGKTDLDKLFCGELVYTGSLRTNVAAIVQSIPLRFGVAGVASELFALSGDVHLVLGNITEQQYTCETADGRGKNVGEALARLARVVCADTEILTRKEIISMAEYICDHQILQVAKSLSKVYSYTKRLSQGMVSAVVTGLGKDFIARKAAEKIGVDQIVDLERRVQKDVSVATPAFAVALMTVRELEGENAEWTL